MIFKLLKKAFFGVQRADKSNLFLYVMFMKKPIKKMLLHRAEIIFQPSSCVNKLLPVTATIE